MMIPRSRDRGRKRSRSKSRDRGYSPTKGPTDSTSDPGTVNARIFVGSITANITRDVLQKHFSRWGNVVGISVTKNKFGFVQFDTDESAQRCLSAGYSTTVDGVKLDVKPAKIGPGLGTQQGSSAGASWGGRGGKGNSRFSDRTVPFERERASPRRDEYYDSYYRDIAKEERNQPDFSNEYSSDYYRDYYDRERERDRERDRSYYRDGGAPPAPPPQQAPSDDTSASRVSELDSLYPKEPLDPLDPSRPNDVEIVVPNKLQRSYAEQVESQLKRINLLVDLLFPPPDITPQRVLSDLSARNCLYAIFVTMENEKHNSLTLNILHGETQEHRNMPVDDALRLIQQNFEDYVKKNRRRNMREVVPRDVRNLVLDLLEMRPLSMGDLDKLIKYLRERQNALVDDQIEQKRETAGTQPAISNMAITYPGVNYLATSVPGTASGSPANHTANVLQSATAAVAGSVNIVPTAPYQTSVTYPGMPAIASTGIINAAAFGISQISSTPAPAPIIAPSDNKQSELQERILNLMKGQGVVSGSPAVAAPVPAPTAVPAPSVMQSHVWSTKSLDHGKVGQGNQTAYNPWNQ